MGFSTTASADPTPGPADMHLRLIAGPLVELSLAAPQWPMFCTLWSCFCVTGQDVFMQLALILLLNFG
jgi:hypothetical protein